MDPNRDTETEARPIKPTKTVKKIKSTIKTIRKSLSLDEPIVRRKKEAITGRKGNQIGNAKSIVSS